VSEKIDPGQAWLLFQLLLLEAGAQIVDHIPDEEGDNNGEH
jgi:hypothetical protein